MTESTPEWKQLERMLAKNLNKIAKYTERNLPEKWAFLVLAAPSEGKSLVHISNAKRESLAKLCLEFVIKISLEQEGTSSEETIKRWIDETLEVMPQ